MPRPRNTKTRRRQIVDGLLQVMAEKSYEKATVASVARAAGLTPGVVHYHFKSKQEILLELTRQLAEGLSERYQTMAPGADPTARLDAFIDARLATGPGADPRAVACWVAIGTEASRQEEVGEIYRRVMEDQIAELVEILQQLCENERVRDAAVAVVAAIEGCYQVAVAAPELAPPGFAARSVKAMARGLLTQKRS